MKKKTLPVPSENIDSVIQTIRGQKVILDADLARIYGIPVIRFNQAVKRNADRFPEDFRFRLTKEEWETARFKITNCDLKHRTRAPSKYLPSAFTEHGAIMAANVLNSPRAVQMSVFVVRAFLKMRAVLADTHDLARTLAALEAELKSRLDVHEAAIVDVLQRIMQLLDPPPEPEPPKKEIGFHARPEQEGSGRAKGRKR
jgi:ORF6N domain.